MVQIKTSATLTNVLLPGVGRQATHTRWNVQPERLHLEDKHPECGVASGLGPRRRDWLWLLSLLKVSVGCQEWTACLSSAVILRVSGDCGDVANRVLVSSKQAPGSPWRRRWRRLASRLQAAPFDLLSRSFQGINMWRSAFNGRLTPQLTLACGINRNACIILFPWKQLSWNYSSGNMAPVELLEGQL